MEINIMLKLIKNENEFKMIDENSNWSLNLDCDFEKKCGKNYHTSHGKPEIKFTDNNGFTRYIAESKVVDGYTMEYKTEKKSITKSNNSTSTNQKWSWLDYATDEEKQTIEDIKNACIKRHDDEVNNPLYQLKLKQKKLLEELEKINKDLVNKPSSQNRRK